MAEHFISFCMVVEPGFLSAVPHVRLHAGISRSSEDTIHATLVGSIRPNSIATIFDILASKNVSNLSDQFNLELSANACLPKVPNLHEMPPVFMLVQLPSVLWDRRNSNFENGWP